MVADTTALSKITNNYAIAISDTAADIAADYRRVNGKPKISSITLTGTGTPILALTAAQLVADAAVLSKISNSSYAITLTDAGTPTLVLTAAQLAADATVLSKINNATYAVTVKDTAANIIGEHRGLNSQHEGVDDHADGRRER